jgi:sterol desaturase/sphingolipid hydroxylase (fatty acid hydroxylase superfamily)
VPDAPFLPPRSGVAYFVIVLLACLFLGLLAWSLFEYGLHRLLGHARIVGAVVRREHTHHHVDPGYFTPLARKSLGVLPVFGGLAAIVHPWAGAMGAAGAASGMALGWIAYEVLHQAIHLRAPRGAHGTWARRHHLYHHFCDSKVNHGVTTPLWDWVFGTYVRPDVVVIPRRHAAKFPWLIGDAGAARAEWADSYRVC